MALPMQRILLVLVAGILMTRAGVVVGDGQPTTRPASGDLKSPRDTMLSFDKLVRVGGEETGVLFFLTRTDDERAVAKSYSRVEAAVAKLQDAVAARFGNEFGLQFLHALGDESREDILAADIQVAGDRATVRYVGDHAPNYLVRVDGVWLFDVSEDIHDMGGTGKPIVELMDRAQKLVDAMSKQLGAGGYSAGEEIVAAAKKAGDELAH